MSRATTGRSMGCDWSLEALSARLDGELPADEAVALDKHLAGCASCRRTAAALEVQHRRLRIHSTPPVPALAEPVLAASRPSSRIVTPWRVAVAVAAVLPMALGAAWAAESSHRSPPPLLALAEGRATSAPRGGASLLSLDVTNKGGGDRVVDASSPAADLVELHETELDGGLPVMRAVTSVPVPSRATESFGSNGPHLMLVGLHDDLQPGEEVTLSLHFARAGTVEVTAVVVAA